MPHRFRWPRRAVLAGLAAWPWAARGGVTASRRTRFGRLEISEEDGLVVLREDGQIQSAIDPRDPTRLVYDYLETMAAIVQRRAVPGGRALVVGLGGGSFGRWLANAGYTVDGVDINRPIIRLARQHLQLDPRIRVVIRDGRRFVERADRRWDVIILDAQSEDYVPPHLLTVQWFTQVQAHLAPGGWALMNSWHGAPRATDELATWRAVFADAWVICPVVSLWDNRILVGGGAPAGLPPTFDVRAVPRDVGRVRRDP